MTQATDLKDLVMSSVSSPELNQVLANLTKGHAEGVQDEETIRQAILSSGLIEKLTDKVKKNVKKPMKKGMVTEALDALLYHKGQKVLRLGIIKGRALVGLNNMEADATHSLQVHAQFENARFSTKRVMSQVEPVFNEFAEFDLPAVDINSLIELDCPIHIVLTQKPLNSQENIIGVAEIEWRKVLHSGRSSSLVELSDPNHPQITVGILDMVLEFLPMENMKARKDEIEYHIKRQSTRKQNLEATFYLYAKQWWSDYLQIRSSHASRLVKIFSNDEFGARKPVTSFISPITCRWLETPRHAARFVSLIDFAPNQRIGDSSSLEVWQSLHSFMSVEKGDIQDHCILLCSLLLGFHLDAYVTLGTDSTNSAHMWVTTIDARGNAKFWEPLTGVQFGQTDNHHFRTVGCCFNNNNLYANIQVLDAAEKVKFKISDPSYWKKMENTDPLPSPSIGFTLLPPAELNIKIAELEIEQVLKQLVEFYRKDHYLACSWDESLPTLLGQSLWSMEYGKVSGQSISHFSDDFQMGVKRSIPDGHTFKGFPMAFNHTHPQRMMQTMSKSKQCREILVTRGDVVRMAIRVKIFVYCERVICCWVMIASRSLQ